MLAIIDYYSIDVLSTLFVSKIIKPVSRFLNFSRSGESTLLHSQNALLQKSLAGLIIERRQIDVYNSDSFHALSQRVYENEVSMLIEALKKYDSDELQMIKPDNTELHKRMPPEIEKDLLNAFEIYKEKHSTERKVKYQ